MKRAVLICMVVMYAVLQSAAVIADIFTVSVTTDTDCSDSLCDFQSALTTAATNGEDDILNLDTGDFIATPSFTYDSSESNSLTIRGDGKSATYLDGNITNQVLRINTSATSNAHIDISDLTIANGNAEGQSGGGLYLFTSNSNITIERCGFVDNHSAGSGGGACINLGGFLSESNTVSINDCTFNQNRAYNGAGLYLNVYNPTVNVEGNRFSRNDLDDPGRGGGAYIESGWGPVKVAENWFERNFNGTMGAGLYLYAGGMGEPVVVEGNEFRENRLYNGGMGAGAYVFALDRPLSFVGNTLEENTVDGISGTADGGGGLYASVVGSMFSSCTVLNNAFVGNGSPVTGTATWINGESSILFANNTVAYNGSLLMYDPASTAVRLDGPGAGIYNNIFLANVEGPDLKVQEGPYLPVELFNNIILDGDYDLPPSTNMGGNRDEDPLLGPYPGFHISTFDSPAIDEGQVYTGLPSVDIDGEARQIDVPDVGTAVVDIGADEVGGIVILAPLKWIFEAQVGIDGILKDSRSFNITNVGVEDITIVDTTLENDGPYGDPTHDWWIRVPKTGIVVPPGVGNQFRVEFGCNSLHDDTNKLIVETSVGTFTADLIGDFIPQSFTDSDLDGVLDHREQGPGLDNSAYDGNCDFVPDRLQKNVASLPVGNDHYVTIVAPHDQIGTGDTYPDAVHPFLYDVAYSYHPDESGGPSSGSEYPYGFFEFKVSTDESMAGGGGGSFPVTIILPSDGPRINGYVKRMRAAGGGLSNYNFTHRSIADDSDIPEELADLVGAWYEDVTFIDNSVPPLDPPPPCVGETHQVIHLMLRDGLFGDFDQTAEGKVEDPGGPAIIPVDDDADDDGLPDDQDNCPDNHNPGQEDTSPPGGNGIGDACECEGNFDCDDDCDGSDAFAFKVDFGRSQLGNPCESGNPCNGDFDCDHDCDGSDAFNFKTDFGRSSFGNPCPACTVGDWCVYP